MEDVITEAAPPSRLLEEDLNNFTPPSPSLPSPFLIFPHTHNSQQPLQPTLLIISLSPTSLSLFHHHINPKTLVASLILPELSLSLPNNTLDIHSLSLTTLLAAVRFPVPADRAHSVSNLLLGDQIRPEKVIILDSLQPMNYRGRLSSDRAVAFKLESSAERKMEKKLLEALEYYPSGSVVDGLAAAVLGQCQILNLRASLCVSWPQFEASVVKLIKELLRQFEFSMSEDEDVLKLGKSKDHVFQSHLYI